MQEKSRRRQKGREGGREARKMDENQGTGKRKAATDCRLAVSVSVNERHTESGK